LLILDESFIFFNNQKRRAAELVKLNWGRGRGGKINFEIPNMKNCARTEDSVEGISRMSTYIFILRLKAY
jgi:hypothetical protein